ncbi:MAG TPA: class I SAM-dependent methyltransferase [Solirubrobacteraceae bacterium]|nr:class I SAM-dependent methyltransferase [Solirubrobacteraceae bacterium]
MLEAVPDGAHVLDVGCATGYVAAELKTRGCTVIGFEQDRASAELAKDHCVDVIVGDLEREDARESLPRGHDIVLFGDVLEHLRDPLPVLAWAQTRLASGGRVVVSLPNIAVWFARQAVARGKFPYADSGVFDRTHLRFFTRDTARALAEQAGYAIDRERYTPTVLPFEVLSHRLLGTPFQWDSAATNRLRWAAARWWPTMFALQFVLTLNPAPDGGRRVPPAGSV